MLEPEDVYPGMPLSAFTAADYADIIAAAREAMNPRIAPPLEWVGDRITLARPDSFYATLSGASSPYSFTEKYGTTGGAWATRVRTGTTNAYEVNGKASLNGKTVLLRPGYPGEYLFQWVGNSGGGVVSLCSCTVPTTLTDTYAQYDLSNTLIAGPATVGMTYMSEVAFSGCTSRGAGFRSNSPLDPSIYTAGTGFPWDGINRYLVARCNLFTIELRIISPSTDCFYGFNFAASTVCSPFVVTGNTGVPGLSPYTKHTLTP